MTPRRGSCGSGSSSHIFGLFIKPRRGSCGGWAGGGHDSDILGLHIIARRGSWAGVGNMGLFIMSRRESRAAALAIVSLERPEFLGTLLSRFPPVRGSEAERSECDPVFSLSDCVKVTPDNEPENICASDVPRSLENLRGAI